LDYGEAEAGPISARLQNNKIELDQAKKKATESEETLGAEAAAGDVPSASSIGVSGCFHSKMLTLCKNKRGITKTMEGRKQRTLTLGGGGGATDVGLGGGIFFLLASTDVDCIGDAAASGCRRGGGGAFLGASVASGTADCSTTTCSSSDGMALRSDCERR